ncbi:MAG: FtsW/RodA/SpoVE family cell cycle protein, partial [Oscillospiraceae bacterium]|nr:FtsW/RodA/SpoVE family cell cycle protein [Oscillospiraceae bacterium]
MDKKEKSSLTLGRPDIIFIILVISLTAFGIFMLMSASAPRAYARNDETGLYFVNRQLIYVAIGAATAFLISSFKGTRFIISSTIFTWFVYLFTVLGLALTPFIGATANDTSLVRSINIGPVTIQFSEIAKFTVPLILAWWIATFYDKFTSKNIIANMKYILAPIILAAIPIVLVLVEKHKSATLILGCIFLVVLFVGNLNGKLVLLGLFGAILAG